MRLHRQADQRGSFGGKYPLERKEGLDDLYHETIQLIHERAEDYSRSLDAVKNFSAELKISEEQIMFARELTRVPDRFFFYRISWVGPHIGLICSIRFPKPSAETKDGNSAEGEIAAAT